MLVVHTDTSSGVTSDLAAVRRAIDAAAHPALYVVDLVASLAAAPFDMDALGVDVAMGASQKGLMCPPGLGYVAVNARALAFAEAHGNQAQRARAATEMGNAYLGLGRADRAEPW